MDAKQKDYKGCKIIVHYSLNCQDYAGVCYVAYACTITYPDDSSECMSINNSISGLNEVYSHIDKKILIIFNT
jgi:hypothetical protein